MMYSIGSIAGTDCFIVAKWCQPLCLLVAHSPNRHSMRMKSCHLPQIVTGLPQGYHAIQVTHMKRVERTRRGDGSAER